MRSYRACHRRTYVLRWVVTLGAVVIGTATGDRTLIVIGLALFAFLEFSVRRQLQAYLSGDREVTITMTDDEYRTQGPDRATARTWSTFTKVERVGEFWVLRVSNVAALGLPTAVLDEQQTSQFVAFLREKGLYK